MMFNRKILEILNNIIIIYNKLSSGIEILTIRFIEYMYYGMTTQQSHLRDDKVRSNV